MRWMTSRRDAPLSMIPNWLSTFSLLIHSSAADAVVCWLDSYRPTCCWCSFWSHWCRWCWACPRWASLRPVCWDWKIPLFAVPAPYYSAPVRRRFVWSSCEWSNMMMKTRAQRENEYKFQQMTSRAEWNENKVARDLASVRACCRKREHHRTRRWRTWSAWLRWFSPFLFPSESGVVCLRTLAGFSWQQNFLLNFFSCFVFFTSKQREEKFFLIFHMICYENEIRRAIVENEFFRNYIFAEKKCLTRRWGNLYIFF